MVSISKRQNKSNSQFKIFLLSNLKTISNSISFFSILYHYNTFLKLVNKPIIANIDINILKKTKTKALD